MGRSGSTHPLLTSRDPQINASPHNLHTMRNVRPKASSPLPPKSAYAVLWSGFCSKKRGLEEKERSSCVFASRRVGLCRTLRGRGSKLERRSAVQGSAVVMAGSLKWTKSELLNNVNQYWVGE
jgi:hypothetical protein